MLAVLLALAAVAAQEVDLPVLRPGEAIEGTIEDGDPVVETEALRAGGFMREDAVLGKTFLVQVNEPGTYRVELRSYFFDSYLILRSGSGEVLAEDDDGLIGLHSRLVTTRSPTDAVCIEACALHGGRGRFELHLERGDVQSLSPAERAQAEIADARRRTEVLEAAYGPQHLDVATSLHNFAELLRAQGDYAGARRLYERALAIREKVLGGEHPYVAASLNGLALLLAAQGDYVMARPLYERALAIWEKARGGEHPDVATSLSNLGRLLCAQGDYAGARPLYERALAIREKVLGGEHPDVATGLNDLGSLLYDQEDYAGARPLYERALAIWEKALGGEHADVAAGLNNLANLLYSQRDDAGARPLYERALAIQEKVLGGQHLYVAASLNNVAVLLQAQGDYAGARPLHERALAIREKVLGGEHPDVARSLNDLALLLWAEGDYVGARPLYERALAIREKALGSDHLSVASSLNNLAVLLQDQGDYAGARPLYERALAIREKVLGGEHLKVAVSLNNLGSLLEEQGDYAGARPLYERSLAIWEKALGSEHADVAISLNNLACLLEAQGDYGGARPLHERALAIWEKALGGEHPYVAASLTNLAGLLEEQGDHGAARPLYERSLAIWEKVLSGEHPDMAASLDGLAELLEAQGDYAGARPLHERALAIREKALGSEHTDVAMSLNNLALLHGDLGALPEAVDLLDRAERVRTATIGRTLATLSEAEMHGYLAELVWQLEARLSSVAWGAAPSRVYGSLLAWKGQVLRLSRLGRERLAASLTPEVRDGLSRLHAIQGRLSQVLTRSSVLSDERDPRNLDALIAERGRLERELQQIGDPLRVDAPSWERVRGALPSNSALVDLFEHRIYERAEWEGERLTREGRWSEARVSAWVTRAGVDEPVLRDLGSAKDIEAAVRAFLEGSVDLRGVSLGSATDPNDELRRLIWDPLVEHLADIDRIFVSPDGVLATLPFEILRGEDERYLVQDRSFVYLTDPAMLVEISRRSTAHEDSSLLAVGGVDYSNALESAGQDETGSSESVPAAAGVETDALASALRKGSRTDVWHPLDATQPEAAQVHTRHALAVVDGTRLLLQGSAATEERLKAELPRHAVLHLATHGYFQPEGWASLEDAAEAAVEEAREHPWQESFYEVSRRLQGYHPGLLSGLVCAGVNRGLSAERDDGYLTAEEVSWLDLSGVDLAVLSACDTGLGRPQSGEGLLGLRRSFLMSGCKTVVSSLWSVRDQDTSEFMDLFYRNLWQRGMGKQQALRAAQLETIEKNQARHGHARPATWGAFVLDGDWR